MSAPRTVTATIRALQTAEVPFCLIGAVALSVRGVVRATVDVDFLATSSRALVDATWSAAARSVSVDVRRGDDHDPLRGVVRVGKRSTQVDVVVPRGTWLADVLERATEEVVEAVGGIRLPVAVIEDIVLLKVDAAGTGDLRDIDLIFETFPERRQEFVAHVERYLPRLSEYSVSRWKRLLADG